MRRFYQPKRDTSIKFDPSSFGHLGVLGDPLRSAVDGLVGTFCARSGLHFCVQYCKERLLPVHHISK